MLKKDDLPRSVERAFAILETLDCSGRTLNVSEVSRKLGIPKSTTHVLMISLERIGYVVRNNRARGYALAVKACSLGNQTPQTLSLPQIALPHLQDLSDQTGLTGNIAILGKNQAIYVQTVKGSGLVPLDTYVGKRVNLHCTAVGKVLLAYGPEPALLKFLSKGSFSQHTARTIVSPQILRRELNQVKVQHYAVDDREEELGVRSLAVPLFNESGEFIAALGLTGTAEQIPLTSVSQLAALCLRASSRIHIGNRPLPAGAKFVFAGQQPETANAIGT